jgi:3-methylcrotonyl-CoA carboxylase alpha subunit
MIRKLLIANRGEIACRIARTCRRLGIAVATVHSEADRDALHVRDIGESIAIGAAPASASYLNVGALLRAAVQVGADAVHPGIGFLSEDPNFASAVEAQGLIFIGPQPQTMRRFADKWAAKREAREANVPVISGTEGSSSDAAAIQRAILEVMQLPVVLKAAAGGGGRGVRIVRSPDGLLDTIESAMREAQSSFGRPDLIVEELVENARHLEVQIAGDGRGHALHLFERECSLQRRFQKIIEEAPAANLSGAVRERILHDAVNLAQRVQYRNLGTMEFLVAGDRHFFLECNPRLQVEHTVTEEITGLDLVELQLEIAATGKLSLDQRQIAVNSHAIQARVYAEDPAAGFIPSTGVLSRVEFPHDKSRVETGVETGSSITPHYDPMIAKIICRGATRQTALDHLVDAVKQTVVLGVKTNLDFLVRLLSHPVVQAGTADNRFIDRELSQPVAAVQPQRDIIAACAAVLISHWSHSAAREEVGLWAGDGDLLGWRYDDGPRGTPTVPALTLTAADGHGWTIAVSSTNTRGLRVIVDGEAVSVRLQPQGEGRYQVEVADRMFNLSYSLDNSSIHLQGYFGALSLTIAPFLSLEVAASTRGGLVRAPMMGVIVKVNVEPNDEVNIGDVLVVEESMKMELLIEAPCRGRVTAVNCAPGDMVERHQVVVDVAPSE